MCVGGNKLKQIQHLRMGRLSGEVSHPFHLGTGKAEAGGSLSLRPAWSTEFPGQPELNKQNKQKKEKAVNIANQRKQITEEEKGLKS